VKYNGIGIVTLAYSMGWVEAESTILPLILPGWLFGGACCAQAARDSTVKSISRPANLMAG